MLTNKSVIVSHQYNIWKNMLNFDNSPKGNGSAFSFGIIYGWIYYLVRLLDIRSLTWEFLVKLIGGVVSAVVIGFFVKVMNTFYEARFEDTLKNKIFKKKRNGKPKPDHEKAA